MLKVLLKIVLALLIIFFIAVIGLGAEIFLQKTNPFHLSHNCMPTSIGSPVSLGVSQPTKTKLQLIPEMFQNDALFLLGAQCYS